ncbi:MAG: isopentenyl-diphosphate Delta-isomerase [Ginsengibacter sp.]
MILVNGRDEQIGTMEKMEAHQKGLLHRAFSVFIFNSNGELLLQQRALGKYHNGGLWTNTCCSHPLPGEDVMSAAHRRLSEEMGITTSLSHAFNFTYRATFPNGLTEHEYDYVFTGTYDGEINIDESEVSDFCFKTIKDLETSIQLHPLTYTEWFKIAFPRIVLFYENNFAKI